MKQSETPSLMQSVDRAGYYRRLLDEGNRSGLSMRELSMRHGVSACTLYMWKRRLHGERSDRPAASRLVAVDVVGSSRGELEASGCYEVILPDGCRVRVPSNFSGARVAELIGALRSC